ncbi:unnamed protein product, partial [Cladocopium goreaui]
YPSHAIFIHEAVEKSGDRSRCPTLESRHVFPGRIRSCDVGLQRPHLFASSLKITPWFPDIWLTICCFFEAVASLVHLQKEHLRRWCSPRWRRSAGDPSVGFCRVWRRMLNHPRLADGHPEADAS